MTETSSARLALPLLAPGQAQKEMTHNEALALLDIAVQPCVASLPTDAPPGAPVIGECRIVGATPIGAWAGHAGHLAGWTDGGWRFVVPREGMSTWIADQAAIARFRDGAWRIGEIAGDTLILSGEQLLNARAGAIAEPSGGGTIDAEARTAIAAILAALRHHRLIDG